MGEEHTTIVVQRYLDELAEDSPAEPTVRALLDGAVRRLHLLCATLLYRSYPRLTQPPLNLQTDELLGAVAERLQAIQSPLQGPAMEVDAQALLDVAEQLVGGKPRGLGQTSVDEGQHLVGTLAGDLGAAFAGEQAGQTASLKRLGQQVEQLAADAEGASDRARCLPVDSKAADHLVTDLDQVAGVEERAGVEEGILNSFGMGMQGAPLREEVRLGVEAAGILNAILSYPPPGIGGSGFASVPEGHNARQFLKKI
jgi:RNA polymerase sigma-70 factor (ECF subfamily)